MYQVRKRRGKTDIIQVPLKTSVLHKSDVFILDSAEKIYVLEGDASTHAERAEANMKAENIEQNRASKAQVTHDIDDGFWELLEGGKERGFCGSQAANVTKAMYSEGDYVEVTHG